MLKTNLFLVVIPKLNIHIPEKQIRTDLNENKLISKFFGNLYIGGYSFRIFKTISKNLLYFVCAIRYLRTGKAFIDYVYGGDIWNEAPK